MADSVADAAGWQHQPWPVCRAESGWTAVVRGVGEGTASLRLPPSTPLWATLSGVSIGNGREAARD